MKRERPLFIPEPIRKAVQVGDVLQDGTTVLAIGKDGFLTTHPEDIKGDDINKKIEKQVREFDTTGEQPLNDVAAALDGMNGKGTSEAPPTLYRPASFPTEPVPSAADGHARDAMPKGDMYVCDENLQPGQVMRRLGPNFVMAPIDPGIAEPLNFKASTPGPLAVKKTIDPWLAGEPVRKSGGEKSLFRDVVQQSSTGSEDQLFGEKA